MIRRLTTATFADRAATRLENGAKLLEALALPQIVDILATLDGPRPLKAFILGPFQTFKSAVGQLHLARNLLVDPGAALWYAPTDGFAKEFSDLKLNPLLDAQPVLRQLAYADKNKTTKLRRNLAGGASILILSAKTEGDRHGKTARDLYLDEVHTYEDGSIGQIRNRRGSYPHEYLELFMSTGLDHGTEGHQEWQDTDQREWHMRCPACHRLIQPRYAHYDPKYPGKIIGGLVYERRLLDTGLPDEAHLAATLRHVCPHCGDALPDTDHSRLTLSGTAKKPRGLYVIQNPNSTPGSHGWRYHALTVRPWLPIVKRFELAHAARLRGDLVPLANCIREEFADIWNPAEHHSEKKLRPTSDYTLGTAWPEALKDDDARPYIFCTVDVQLDHFVVVIRAWGPQSSSRLIWTEKVTTAGRIEELSSLHGVIPARVWLDARHTSQRVRQLCASFGWRCFMGEPEKDYLHKQLGLRRIYSEPKDIDPWIGTAHQGRASVLQVNFSKPAALDRWHLLRTFETNSGDPLWTAATDAPEWYFREIEAYGRIRKQKPSGGEFWEWAVHGPDHAADCEVMQIVVASMAQLVGSESIDTPDTPPPADDTTNSRKT
jgi:hypothetical protein